MNLHAVYENVERHGLAAGVHDLAKKAVNRVMPARVLRVLALPSVASGGAEGERAARLPPGYAGDFLDARAVREASRDERLGLDDAFVTRALARGDRCYGVRREGTLVSYVWLAANETPIDDALAFSFDPAWTYLYKAFTLPAFRGARLYGAAMTHARDRTASRGLVLYVESNNFASIKAARRAGCEDVGTLFAVSLGGARKIFATPSCARLGVALVPIERSLAA